MQPNAHQNIGLARDIRETEVGITSFAGLEKLKDPVSNVQPNTIMVGKAPFLVGLSQYSMNYNVFFAVPSDIRRMFMDFLHQSCVWQLFCVMKHQ